MKRTFLLTLMLLAVLLAASCQKEEQGRILTATICFGTIKQDL